MKIVFGIFAALAILVLTAKIWLPPIFVILAGKSDFSFEKVKIRSVSSSYEALNEMAEKITTETPSKFVTIDFHLPLPLSEIDYYDFQLVERDDYELGQEVNVGDNFQDDAFSALPLDKDWMVAESWDVDSASTYMRLTFKVPEESHQGYLFYWGEYLGPLEFE